MQKGNKPRPLRKAQKQRRPGVERKMQPVPISDFPDEKGSGKLWKKTALITGGDSGIGKAVAILFAKEGCDVAISYLNEHADAKDTRRIVEETYHQRCLLLPGDISRENHCRKIVEKTVAAFGRIDILVNNAAIHYENEKFEEITTKEMQHTFATNIFSFFWVTKYALAHMEKGSAIVNSASVVAYRGSGGLVDYAATKGAIVSFTRSLSANLKERGIRVNGVAPGPIWTPLIVSSFEPKRSMKHGSDVPLGRAGEPAEVAKSYLFLASNDASYMTGQFLHPNGGEVVGS
jgi:NAD(P)-dependent dehydrogenase (short-subunit alcohol dehydrogenase family)